MRVRCDNSGGGRNIAAAEVSIGRRFCNVLIAKRFAME